MRTALLLFIATPGSFALIAIALREIVKAARRERDDEENRARRLRLMNEYSVPDFAVEEVRVLRTAELVAEPTAEPVVPRPENEIQSQYTKGMN